MKQPSKGSFPEGMKVLSEAEIQQKLYGVYLGRRPVQSSQEALPVFAPISVVSNSVPAQAESSLKEAGWTGSEILSGELKRLRSDLIVLREEKEKLGRELRRQVRISQGARAASRAVLWDRAAQRAADLLRHVAVAAVLFACVGMPFGFRFLQASPVGTETSPYTVQVAVYDVRPMAEKALLSLQELGYPAFWVESARLNGKPRYRLYVGRFVTKAEANVERNRLISDPHFSDAFVRLQ